MSMRNTGKSLALFLTASALVIVSADRPLAQAGQEHKDQKAAGTMLAPKHVMMPAADMKWGPAPPGLPAGAQMAVVDGDPSKAGAAFAIRAKFPDGYRVPPHWHPTDENIVVLSGTMMFGMGDTMNPGTMTTIPAGGFAKLPARGHHSAMAKGATEIQLYGIGPFEITYVNPQDDPRKKTTSQTR